MRLLRACLSVIPVLALSATGAISHHAFSPVYDEKRLITVVGVVTQFRFVNPHAMMSMNVTDEAGKVVFRPPMLLRSFISTSSIKNRPGR